MGTGLNAKISSSVLSFCKAMGLVFEIKDFLLILQAQIPKKFQAGELALFYKITPLPLRRAYIRHREFYDEEARSPWPKVLEISYSSSDQNLYFAKELGRPFSKGLIIPLHSSSIQTLSPSLLFVEIKQIKKAEGMKDFFKQCKVVLDIVFDRALKGSSFTRVSYLWSQLFTHWREPLAVLQNFKTIRSNDSFRENLSPVPNFSKAKNLPEYIEAGEKIYHLYYYPMSNTILQQTGILYCQDMTRSFRLRERIFQSEKMADLSALGKNIAHRLNNPLTGIKSMAQILSVREEMNEFKDELFEVEKATTRSQKIIENLLSFSQVNSKTNKKMEEEEKTCNLNEVVSDTLPLLKSVTQGIALKVKFCPGELKTRGDFSMLQQAIYNLALNSCQALNTVQTTENSPPRCIKISLSRTRQNKACLKIRDNGPGISPSNLKKIFEPFWTRRQTDRETDRETNRGTGLGMGIVRQFIKKFGGDIFVSSREKEYTCFTILLPLAKPP